MPSVSPTDDDYRRLLAFRTAIRRFQRWSEEQAARAGLTPAQHQLLLAVRGDENPAGPAIGDLAEHLMLRHNSTVELVDRAEAAGLVSRVRDPGDRRRVRVKLTPSGRGKMRKLAAMHLDELRELGPLFQELIVASNRSGAFG